MSPTSGTKIRILVVDDILETRENLKKLLYFEDDIEIVGSASNGREGVEAANKLNPDIVLMDINMPGMDGIAASEAISTQLPNIQIIMMSVQGEADYLRRSMLAGAREFLIKPFSGEELTNSIRRVHQLGLSRRVMMAPPPVTAAEGAAAALVRPVGGKVFAVYSPKGGVGASTVAVNLAIALHEETKGRVAVVDGNLQFGDIGLLLYLPSQRTIADIVDGKAEPDEELLNSVLGVHSSGIRALAAPPRPELAELVTVDKLKAILAVLRKMNDYIIVDTGKALNDVLLAILDEADQIVLVASADIATLKNCKLFFDVTQALGYKAEKILLVMNKEDGRGVIPIRDIESNIKHPVATTLPRDDRAMATAVTRGVPLLISQRNHLFSANIFRVARLLLAPEGTHPANGGAKPAAAPASAFAAPTPPAGRPESAHVAADPKQAKPGLFSIGRK